MNEFLQTLLIAVITAAVPVITTFVIASLKKAAEEAAANTDDIKAKSYITEIAGAISDAVAATSQTYVDALKKAGEFTVEAQKEAAKKALTACLASISPSAQSFIEAAYGDITEYLTTKIEAEVRKQKIEQPTVIELPAVMESTADTTSIAATTAAATAAAIAQATTSQPVTVPTAEQQE